MAYLGKTPSQAVRSRYYFTASGGETSLSGTDDNGNTLTFTDGNYVDVYLNGVLLVAGTDYNTTTANTIGGLSALAASDIVEVVVYDTFSVFSGNVSSNFSVGGNLTVTGDATFDTNTLYVDSTNNRVGIVNASPTTALDVTGDITVSGGVYVGGTGSANYLDDYEEGTWTPVAAGATTAGTGTYNYQVGSYVKIGDMVQIQASIEWTAHTGSGTFKLTGLPFTSKNTANLFSSFSAYTNELPITSDYRVMPFMQSNTSYIYINQASGSGGASSVNIDSAAQVLLTGTYRV